MPFHIETEESLPDGIQRIVLEETEGALESLSVVAARGDQDAVHDTRKRVKKLRGLARLVRHAVGDEAYASANEQLRDAGRRLSGTRDRQVAVDTFVKLVHHEHGAHEGFEQVHQALVAAASQATKAIGAGASDTTIAQQAFADVGERAKQWSIPDEFAAIAPDLKKTYRRGRTGLAAAGLSPTVENFHDWRKQAKYLWYQIRILSQTAPAVLDPLAESFHELTDYIGDEHDLTVLIDRLAADPDSFGGADRVEAVVDLAAARRQEIRHHALDIGTQLYAEPARRFADRMDVYWQMRRTAATAGERPGLLVQ